MINDIGLIIWGCKGGHRVFCTNNVVDRNDPVINNTIKDIRGFVRFNQNKLNVYALEFTDKYKIYTLYRSCNDSGTGAYVAITIYVPHRLRIENVREVLFKMMNTYFEEYIHPLSNTYIPGKYDDIKPFSALLAGMAQVGPEKRKDQYHVSVQDDTPQIRLYTELSQVDEYFLEPYRPEFFRCQEVMFISKEIFDKIPETLQFHHSPKLIERVSPPEPLPELVFDHALRACIKSIAVDGNLLSSDNPVSVSDYDIIEIVFAKKYYQDFVLKGSIEQLKADGYLRQFGRNLDVVPAKIIFQPIKYAFNFTLNGLSVPDGLIAFSLNPGQDKEYFIQNSRCVVTGEAVTRHLYWGVKATRDADTVFSTTPLDLIKAIDNGGNINLETVVHTFVVNAGDVRSEELWAIVAGKDRIRFTVKRNSQNTVSFELPKEYTTSEITFQCGMDGVIRQQDKVIEILPKENFYTLRIADFNTEECSWYLVIRGQKVYPAGNLIELVSKEDLNFTQLIINDNSFKFHERNHELIPKGIIVAPEVTNQNIEVRFNGRTYDISKWAIFPDMPQIDRAKYDFRSTDFDILKIIKLRKKGSNVNVNRNDRPQKVNVHFINCKGASSQFWSVNSKDEYKTITSNTTISLKGKDCKIYVDSESYLRDRSVGMHNLDNGFFVSYTNGGKDCDVEFSGKSGGSKMLKIGIFAVLALLVLCGIGFGVYKLWPTSTKDMLKCHIEIIDDSLMPDLKNPSDISVVSSAIARTGEKPHIIILDNPKYLKKVCDNYETFADSVATVRIKLKWDGYEEIHELGNRDEILKSIRKYQNDKELTSIKIQIKPQIVEALEVFETESADMSNEEFFAAAKKNAELYPLLSEKMILKSWQKVEASSDTTLLHSYVATALSNDEYRTQAQIRIAEIREAANSKQAQQNREAEIKNQTKSFISQLQNINCTAMTVAKAQNWYNTLSPEEKKLTDLSQYIAAFDMFFNAQNAADLNKKYKKYFSSQQQKVIWDGYGKDERQFKAWKKEFKMSFSEPINQGLIN